MEEQGRSPAHAEDPEAAIAPTPFEGPFAPSLLLLALGLWRAYDGWWNRSPGAARREWLNRAAPAILLLLAVHYFFRALRERRARR